MIAIIPTGITNTCLGVGSTTPKNPPRILAPTHHSQTLNIEQIVSIIVTLPLAVNSLNF